MTLRVDLSPRDIEMLLDACYHAKDTVPRGSKSCWNDIIKRLEKWNALANPKPQSKASSKVA